MAGECGRTVKYLLDTHALLWALTQPEQLGPQARAVIVDPSCELLASAVSAWEIATKQRNGKLPAADPLIAAYPRLLDRLGVTRLPITEEHALVAGRLDWEHRDPFDRMLAAQSMLETATLITKDKALRTLPGLSTLW